MVAVCNGRSLQWPQFAMAIYSVDTVLRAAHAAAYRRMLKKFLGRMAGRAAPPFKAGGRSDAVLIQEQPRAALALAREHFSHGRIADAEAICDAVLAHDASDFEAVSLKAGVHWARAELVPATRLARKAAALDPGSATAQANLGALLMDTGDFPAASAILPWEKCSRASASAARGCS